MYVGHVGAALAGKRAVPALGLGLLLIATYLPDWVDAGLCATGSYARAGMVSHSLPAVAALALAAALTALARGNGARAALVVAAVVASHYALDFFTGIKPTWPGGPMIGLELYAHPVADAFLEAAVITGGWLLYARTLPRGLKSWNDSHLMLALLLLMQAGIDFAHLLLPSISKC